jgi:hypothetical protein
MPTLTQDFHTARPTPKKLGPPPRFSANARDEYHRQLDYLVAEGELLVRDRDFAEAALYAFSDPSAKDFYPSQMVLAELRRCSIRTVQRRLSNLKGAGVMLVAQLKGFDPVKKAWFSSSNTHRVNFVPKWREKMDATRAERREKARLERIAARAMPKRPRAREDGQSRPEVPEFDPSEFATENPLTPEELVAHARRAKDALRSKPPPNG